MIRAVNEKEKNMLKKNHLNKIIGIISAMMLVLGTLSVPVFASENGGELDEPITIGGVEYNFVIYDADDLVELAGIVNGQTTAGSTNNPNLVDYNVIVLPTNGNQNANGVNIDMSGVSGWSGIGIPQKFIGFKGIFNGNGCTISGITLNNSKNAGPKGGLFNLAGNATIENFTINGSVNSNRFIGGVVGRTLGNITVSNVTSGLNLTLSNGASNSIGGIVGQCGSGAGGGTGGGTGSGSGGTSGVISINNCTVTGTLTSTTSTNPVGGLVGHNYAGYTVNASGCTVTASLNCSGGNVGSVVGNNLGTFTISGCTLSPTSSTHTTIPVSGSGTVIEQ